MTPGSLAHGRDPRSTRGVRAARISSAARFFAGAGFSPAARFFAGAGFSPSARVTPGAKLNGIVAALTLAALAALVGLGGSAGCSRGPGSTPERLILVELEAASGTPGCCGDPAARTPFWDRLARRGRSYSMAPDARSGSLLDGGREDGTSVAEALARTPMSTAAMVTPRATAPDPAGFDVVDELPGAGHLVTAALRWTDALPVDRRFFLFARLRPDGPGGDETLGALLRGLDVRDRLGQAMIIGIRSPGDPQPADGRSTEPGEPASPGDAPVVIFGPRPFRGGGVASGAIRRIDVLPTILYAFRHGPDHRLRGTALQTLEIEPH